MSDTTENNDSGSVTIEEAVKEMENEEEHSIAVFGAGDENNCTYIMGYMVRQAVFSCKTCDPMTENPSGVCYACSLSCHHEHNLVELYTKRNFKCDCGNSKFTGFKCKLQETKIDVNENNKYNHNFEGKYCTCNRPYPDPDDEVDDEMIQCIACEDWFHSRHLGCLPPMSYEEMVCDCCVVKFPFLLKYKQLTECPSTKLESKETTDSIDITTCSPSKKRKKTEYNEESESSSSSKIKCKLSCGSSEEEKLPTKALYFKSKWRTQLCQCPDCLTMYKTENLTYLINSEDTIAAYEKKGKEKSSKVMESAANHISQMNHVQQVELMRGYQDLKDNLSDFLKGFSESDKVVTKEDIEGFFAELNKKRSERQHGFPPTTCK